ncbi:MAG: hypothetical protein ACXWPM_12395 [Bdellovibrionota bacterium]
MFNRLLTLVAGIAIGYTLHSFWPAPQKSTPPAEWEVAAPKQAQQLKIVSGGTFSQMAPLAAPTHHAELSVPKTPREPRTEGLNISEAVVSEMEQQREQLRQFAFTTQEQEGWKIQLLPEDRVFLKAGIKSGDLITFESMEKELQNPDRAGLASRMVAILNEIKR